jgi:sugar/nucleoside kinase (ribokinase family)
MSLLVVGSVAFDSIQSPYGKVEKTLGGSATFFALAASFFTSVRVLAVVGNDFKAEHEAVFKKHGIDTRGIEHASGKTFYWSGEYGSNPNDVKTRVTELNVFENFQPKIPPEYRDTNFLFLGNIGPELQSAVHREMKSAKVVGLDTILFWIQRAPQQLMGAMREVDFVIINDSEARQIAKENNLMRAASKILANGPKALVIKHGEYGSTIFFGPRMSRFGQHAFRAPSLPIEEVRDPTGAGDSFAGGFMGYIASQEELNSEVLKRAMFYGGVMGSFAVESFGTERLCSLTREEIDSRFEIFREMTHLD